MFENSNKTYWILLLSTFTPLVSVSISFFFIGWHSILTIHLYTHFFCVHSFLANIINTNISHCLPVCSLIFHSIELFCEYGDICCCMCCSLSFLWECIWWQHSSFYCYITSPDVFWVLFFVFIFLLLSSSSFLFSISPSLCNPRFFCESFVYLFKQWLFFLVKRRIR